MSRKITVAVPDKIYHQARVWAAKRDTSISAVVAYLLDTLPGIQHADRAFSTPRNASATLPQAATIQPPAGHQKALNSGKPTLFL